MAKKYVVVLSTSEEEMLNDLITSGTQRVRKAALIAADQTREATDAPAVTDSHLRDALHAIIAEGGELTQKLLGVAPGVLNSG